MNRWVAEATVLLVVGAFTAGWHYRASIMSFINPPPSAARPAETPDVLYTWVDKDGVTHFSQEPGKGARVEFDGSRITPVAPVEASFSDPLPVPEGQEAPKGSAVLHDMRRNMQDNQIKMQQTKDEAMGL